MKGLFLAAAILAPLGPAPEQPQGVVPPEAGAAFCYPKEGYCVIRFEDYVANQRAMRMAAELLKSCGPVRSM